MNRTFKITVNPDRLVTRQIPMTWDSAAEKASALATLADLSFVQAVSFDEATSSLNVEYDAGHEDIEGIEALLTQRGAHLLGGWRRRIADAWHQFQDHAKAESDDAQVTEPLHTLVHEGPGRRNRQHRP
jgi:hypothetical protein